MAVAAIGADPINHACNAQAFHQHVLRMVIQVDNGSRGEAKAISLFAQAAESVPETGQGSTLNARLDDGEQAVEQGRVRRDTVGSIGVRAAGKRRETMKPGLGADAAEEA